jgi:Family of unknown function (DUF5762)
MEDIWYKDFGTFISPFNLVKFVPTKDMTFTQVLNAVTKFSIYFSVILYLTNHNIHVFYVTIFTALVSVFLYELYAKNRRKEKELYERLGVMLEKGTKQYCMQPTSQNPFMNVLVTDYVDFPNRPKACNPNSTKVKKEIDKFFEKDLYRDVDDVWGRKTNSRQWYVENSTTIPNDRNAFTDFVYNMGPTCKENGLQCYKNMHRELKQ